MSNYQVEPANKPQALTSEAIKALRHEQVQGVSRRELLRGSLAAGIGLWLLEVTAGSLGFLWPNLTGKFGGEVVVGSYDDVKTKNADLPIDQGFPAYYPSAKAFVILVDPSQQRYIPGDDQTGDGHSVNVRALYQRCPHLGCKPNPCVKNFWLECPCHGSRYDRLGIKAAGPQYGPAPRGGNRSGVPAVPSAAHRINPGNTTLGPPRVAAGQPGIEPPRTPAGCT